MGRWSENAFGYSDLNAYSDTRVVQCLLYIRMIKVIALYLFDHTMGCWVSTRTPHFPLLCMEFPFAFAFH